MRSRVALSGCILIFAICTLGCNRNGNMLGGSSSGNEDSSQSQSQKKQPQKQGGQSEVPYVAPQNSVSGQPSAESDSGSSSAVAHRSVAQPGAPEGTLPTQQPPPTPAGKTPGHP